MDGVFSRLVFYIAFYCFLELSLSLISLLIRLALSFLLSFLHSLSHYSIVRGVMEELISYLLHTNQLAHLLTVLLMTRLTLTLALSPSLSLPVCLSASADRMYMERRGSGGREETRGNSRRQTDKYPLTGV